MKLHATLIAAAVVAALSQAAVAADTEYTSSFNTQAGINELNLSAEGDKTLVWKGSTAFVFKNPAEEDLNPTFKGQGSLTLKVQDLTSKDKHAFRFEGAESLTFDGFSSLKIVGEQTTDAGSSQATPYNFILAKGNTSFGSKENELVSFNLTGINLGASWSKDDTDQSAVDIWANNFSTDTKLNVNGFDITVHGADKTTLSNGLVVANGNDAAFDSGDITIKKAEGDTYAVSVSGGSKLTIGADGKPAASLNTIEGGIRIDGEGSAVAIATEDAAEENTFNSEIQGNIYLGGGTSLTWRTGDAKVDGNIRVRDNASLSFGEKGEDGTKFGDLYVVTDTGSDPSNSFYLENGAEVYIGANSFTLEGTYSAAGEKSTSEINATTTNITSNSVGISIGNGSTVKFVDDGVDGQQTLYVEGQNQSVVVNAGGAFEVAAGSFKADGTVSVSGTGSKMLLGSSEKALDSISIESGTNSTVLSLKEGADVDLNAAGDIVIDNGSRLNNESSALNLTGENSSLTLQAGKNAAITGSVSVGDESNAEISASNQIGVKGYVQNNGGTLTLKGDSIVIDARTDASYGYYKGLYATGSGGKTTVEAQTFGVTGSLSAAGSGTNVTVNAVNTVINAVDDRILSVDDGASLTFKDTGKEGQTLKLVASSKGGVLISDKDSTFTVEAGAVSIDGTLQANGATIALGSENKKLTNVSIQSLTKTSALRSNGGNVTVAADVVTIDAGAEGQTAIDAFTLKREGEGDKGALTVFAEESLTINGNIVAGKDSGELDKDYIRHN